MRKDALRVFVSGVMSGLNLFELLLALAVLPFLRLQQTGQLLLLLGQDVLLKLLLLRQDGLCLKGRRKRKNSLVITGRMARLSSGYWGQFKILAA